MGAGVLTNLMGQTVAELADNIALYRQSLSKHGKKGTYSIIRGKTQQVSKTCRVR